MCDGLALASDYVPNELMEPVRHKVVTRGGMPEIRFLYRDRVPLLPVWTESEFLILPWGNRTDRRSRLPQTGWAKTEDVETGKWKHLKPEEVTIPAIFGFAGGVWYHVSEGMKGMKVRDEHGNPHVYMLLQPASHYYQVMTRQERMPVLIGEQL